MASLIFSSDGSLYNTQANGPDKAYVGQEEIPYLSGTQLQTFAAIIYAESTLQSVVEQINPYNPISEMEKEAFAIAYSMYNYTLARGAAEKRRGKQFGMLELLNDPDYARSFATPQYQEYFEQGTDSLRARLATLAVIQLFTQQTQRYGPLIEQLQGGGYWDGLDLFRYFPKHYRARMGMELSEPVHGRLYEAVNLFKGAQPITSHQARTPQLSREYTFLSTLTAGGSVFFCLHPQAKQQGVLY